MELVKNDVVTDNYVEDILNKTGAFLPMTEIFQKNSNDKYEWIFSFYNLHMMYK